MCSSLPCLTLVSPWFSYIHVYDHAEATLLHAKVSCIPSFDVALSSFMMFFYILCKWKPLLKLVMQLPFLPSEFSTWKFSLIDQLDCCCITHFMPAWKNQLVEKLQEQGRVATIPCSPTEVNILRHPGTIKEGYHSMLNNPGEHSAALYFKDTLDTSPSLHLATSVAE